MGLFHRIADSLQDFWWGLFGSHGVPLRAGSVKGARIYVGNLSYGAKQDEVRDLFTPFGRVVSAHIVRDRVSRRPKGFAFVEMSTAEEAQRALKLNGTEFMSRKLTVSEAKSEGRRPGGNDEGRRPGGHGRRGGRDEHRGENRGEHRGDRGRDRGNRGQGGDREQGGRDREHGGGHREPSPGGHADSGLPSEGPASPPDSEQGPGPIRGKGPRRLRWGRGSKSRDEYPKIPRFE